MYLCQYFLLISELKIAADLHQSTRYLFHEQKTKILKNWHFAHMIDAHSR